MADILALLIPIVAVIGFWAWMIARSPVGRAFADRLQGTDGSADRAELEASIAALRSEVAELTERLDFAERLLADRREPKLGAGQ